jgi:hypothetical protein
MLSPWYIGGNLAMIMTEMVHGLADFKITDPP